MLSRAGNVWRACVRFDENTIAPKWETEARIPGECCTYSKQSVMTNHVRDTDGRDTSNQYPDVYHKII